MTDIGDGPEAPSCRAIRPWRARAIGALLMCIAGCGTEVPIPLDMPDGWLTDDRGRWWTADTDTSRAFRDLSTFAAMGVTAAFAPYVAGEGSRPGSPEARRRMVAAVQRELIALYRNRPETIDSLFRRYAEPHIEAPSTDTAPDAQVAREERAAYRRISRHFSIPFAVRNVGTDIAVAVPDSLTSMAAGQAVRFQVYVDDSGRPRAIRSVASLHPILDRIALRAVAQVRWQPAYLLSGTRSVPVDAWVRFGVRFPGSASDDLPSGADE